MTNSNKDIVSNTSAYEGIPGIKKRDNDERIAAWQRLQFGLFIHWGLYSVLGGERNGEPVTIGYSEQIQMWADMPEAEYLHAANQLTADQFDADCICQLAKAASMNYIIITRKHHDGFAMYHTDTTDYNIFKATTFHKDPLILLADACRRHDLKFGVYFSLVDWHQGHDFDQNNNNPISRSMEKVLERQLRELMTEYGPIAEVWFDMSSPRQAQSEHFAAIVRQFQPGAVINSRIWNNAGDFRTLGDNQIPSNTLDGPWQTPASIYHETWGYRKWQVRDDFFGKVRHLVESLVRVRARGGNYLLNIGPRGDGAAVEFEEDVLRKIGEWIGRHKEAVMDAMPTWFDAHAWGEITCCGNHLYLHLLDVPEDRKIVLSGLETDVCKVAETGSEAVLDWRFADNTLTVQLPERFADDILPVVRVELTDDLRVIPRGTVYADDDHSWTVKSDDIYDGHGFADQGNYNSLVETTVRKTCYIANGGAGHIMLKLFGKTACTGKQYRVNVGDESKNVTGHELFASEIGPFTAAANEVITFSITLANPEYREEDLGVVLERVEVEKWLVAQHLVA